MEEPGVVVDDRPSEVGARGRMIDSRFPPFVAPLGAALDLLTRPAPQKVETTRTILPARVTMAAEPDQGDPGS